MRLVKVAAGEATYTCHTPLIPALRPSTRSDALFTRNLISSNIQAAKDIKVVLTKNPEEAMRSVSISGQSGSPHLLVRCKQR